VHFYYIFCHTRGHPKPAGAGAGAEMHPRVYLRAGFFQPRGFVYERVFIKPAPTSAGALPRHEASVVEATSPRTVGRLLTAAAKKWQRAQCKPIERRQSLAGGRTHFNVGAARNRGRRRSRPGQVSSRHAVLASGRGCMGKCQIGAA